MTNCRVEKKVHGETLASRGNISSNSRKQYANGEVGVRARRTDGRFDGVGMPYRWYALYICDECNGEKRRMQEEKEEVGEERDGVNAS